MSSPVSSRSTRSSLALGVSILLAGAALGQGTTRVSIGPGGQLPNDDAYGGIVSDDGRYVTFFWYESFVRSDSFLKDLATGTLEQISVSSSGVPGDSYNYAPGFTPDLRYFVFSSYATNLVPGDTNGPYPTGFDVFVRDRQAGTTERVSVGSLGQQGDGESAGNLISADGRYVAFNSDSTNLVPGDTNGLQDSFVHDRTTGSTELVSVGLGGSPADGLTYASSISADGRYVVLFGHASNLVAGDTNGRSDVFLRDRTAGTTSLVSVAIGVAPADGLSAGGVMTPDGRWVIFSSEATNLVPGDTNGARDVFVRDLLAGTTERISLGSGAVQGNGPSNGSDLTPDGRYAVFTSTATNLAAGDVNGETDVFLRDRWLGTTEIVSLAAGGGQGTNDAWGGSVSADGRLVAFDSRASFEPGDTDSFQDVYVRDRGELPRVYCTAGTTSGGCVASIAASENPSASLANPCAVTVSGIDGQRAGILFYGIDNARFRPSPWGMGSSSYLCTKPPAQRTGLQGSGGTSGLCDGSFVLDWNAYQASHPLALGNPWSVGAHVYVQGWFRDPPAPRGTNLSDAVELTYRP